MNVLHSSRHASPSACCASLLLCLALVGCAADPSAADDAPPEAEPLALAASRSVLLEGIGDAENAAFSEDGRLFVTGGANVYEIARQGVGYAATPLYDGPTCNFTGVVVRGGTLYASCLGGAQIDDLQPHLLAGALSARVTMRVIYDYAATKFPNGMAFDDAGRLLVADFMPLAGQIMVLTLDGPEKVAREQVWRSGGLMVNGLKVYQGSVYVTDGGSILRIPITAEGRAGRATTLASRLSVFDDLLVDAEGIVAADFLGKKLAFFSPDGKLLRESAAVFDTPSSIARTRGPLLSEGALLVTEKGALNELTSRDGNRLSLYVP